MKLDNLLFRLLPGRCLLCNQASHRPRDLCADCEADLPWQKIACPGCAIPLPAGTPANTLCGTCLNRTPVQDAAFAAFTFDFPLDALIRAFKFHDHRVAARVLGDLFADAAACWPDVDALLPVPLHVARRRERGFNQAEVLARSMNALIVRKDLARRTRATEEQAGKSAVARRRNLRGAFELTGRELPERIGVVDDVMTTGSTTAELVALLKRHGVKYVDVRVLARTP